MEALNDPGEDNENIKTFLFFSIFYAALCLFALFELISFAIFYQPPLNLLEITAVFGCGFVLSYLSLREKNYMDKLALRFNEKTS